LPALAATAREPLADGREFTFLYQTSTLPRAEHEYEQWVTWQTNRESDPEYDRLEFRQEFEHGISDRLQFGFYLATWRYTRTSSGEDTAVHDTAVELVYNLADPAESALGAAVYGEVKLDREFFEVEGKLLLEKPVGAWVLAYNAVIESEWEGTDWGEDSGELAQLLGVSRRLSPRLSIGGEVLHEVGFADWKDAAQSALHAGPNLALRHRAWWTTATALVQVTSVDAEPGLQLRVLVGKPF